MIFHVYSHINNNVLEHFYSGHEAVLASQLKQPQKIIYKEKKTGRYKKYPADRTKFSFYMFTLLTPTKNASRLNNIS